MKCLLVIIRRNEKMAKYQFGDVIGRGGFGEVLEGKRVEDGWQCAIKRLSVSADEEDRKRFYREVRMQAQLRHKNVVPIIGYNLKDDPPWFVMPRALFSLREYLTNHKGENELWIIYEIAAGIGHAHNNGVIHRDLKPENILFFQDQNNQLYVAVGDFGLGRFVTRDSPSLTQTNIRMGTIEYMAPEQYTDAKNVDPRADIYALGKVLYEILTGEIPYPEMDYSKVPRKFIYIIQKACQNNREERYRSIKEMINDLDVITQEERLLTKPAEVIRDEVRAILEEQDFSASKIEKLARLLMENTDDNEVLTRILPELPDPILQSLIKNHISMFTTVFKAYDEAVSGALPFEYCDVVTDFYEKVFFWTDSDEVKVMIIKRLPNLGHSHNRWHVGIVFARIVSKINDPSLILAVKDVLQSDNDMAAWCKEYLDDYSLPSGIREALKKLSSSKT